MTMTMTTTAAQELLRGDAQIEAPPVGGFTHGLDPILDKSLNTGKCYVEESHVTQKITSNKYCSHGLNPILENPF